MMMDPKKKEMAVNFRRVLQMDKDPVSIIYVPL